MKCSLEVLLPETLVHGVAELPVLDIAGPFVAVGIGDSRGLLLRLCAGVRPVSNTRWTWCDIFDSLLIESCYTLVLLISFYDIK